jgi:hypothetical protein
LGSFIGTESYIRINLKDKLFELNEQKLDLINNVDNYQNRILLLRQCYDWKINHLFRTLPPQITDNLSNKFETFQKDILKSVLFINPDFEIIPNNSWLQSLLKFEDGGLNIQNIKLVKTSAYAASTTQCLSTIIDNLNQILTEEIDIKDIFSDINSSPESITDIKIQFKNYYECIYEIQRCDSKFNPQYFLTTLITEKKIQKILTDTLYDYNYKNNHQYYQRK